MRVLIALCCLGAMITSGISISKDERHSYLVQSLEREQKTYSYYAYHSMLMNCMQACINEMVRILALPDAHEWQIRYAFSLTDVIRVYSDMMIKHARVSEYKDWAFELSYAIEDLAENKFVGNVYDVNEWLYNVKLVLYREYENSVKKDVETDLIEKTRIILKGA